MTRFSKFNGEEGERLIIINYYEFEKQVHRFTRLMWLFEDHG